MSTVERRPQIRKRNGVCTDCGDVLARGSSLFCQFHVVQQARYHRRFIKKQKAARLCTSCAAPAVSVRYCAEHLEKARLYSQERRAELKRLGLCAYCKNPAINHRCEDCKRTRKLKAQQARNRRRLKTANQAGGSNA